MRKATKVAIVDLAKVMVSSGCYKITKGTGDFIIEALRIHKSSNSFVCPETIKKHERELEQICRHESKELQEKQVWNRLYDSEGEELSESEAIEFISSEIILEKAKEIQDEMVQWKTPVKDYSMFIEDEDGLRVIRGSYKGKYVYEIDSENFIGCAAGWSKYQLKLNEELGSERKGALTEDDKNVFLDIMSNKI